MRLFGLHGVQGGPPRAPRGGVQLGELALRFRTLRPKGAFETASRPLRGPKRPLRGPNEPPQCLPNGTQEAS
eukprot:4390060-Pyramimonas_sp.AAC.1